MEASVSLEPYERARSSYGDLTVGGSVRVTERRQMEYAAHGLDISEWRDAGEVLWIVEHVDQSWCSVCVRLGSGVEYVMHPGNLEVCS